MYQVSSIITEKRKFIIQTASEKDCEAKTSGGDISHLNKSMPFHVVAWCGTGPKDQKPDTVLLGDNEVELSWEPPEEPLCSSSSDCRGWPNSSCNMTKDGNKRCLCNTKFRWDGLSLNCTQGEHTFNTDNER